MLRTSSIKDRKQFILSKALYSRNTSNPRQIPLLLKLIFQLIHLLIIIHLLTLLSIHYIPLTTFLILMNIIIPTYNSLHSLKNLIKIISTFSLLLLLNHLNLLINISILRLQNILLN